jgi:hypothetical protein
MNFAQALTTENVAQAFGWPAAIIIIALVGALYFTVRLLLKSYDKIDAIQERRLADAKETRDKFVEPLENQTEVIGRIYDIVLRNAREK